MVLTTSLILLIHCTVNAFVPVLYPFHLERHKDSDTIWKCPTSSDKQKVKREQILNCPIEGEWDMESSDRALKFHLNNLAKVVKLYSKLL